MDISFIVIFLPVLIFIFLILLLNFIPVGLWISALAAGVIAPVLLHPAEMVAAAVWFSMVTWLMLRTRNIWDCVAAHAVTNLLLGAYVVTTGEWQFM